MNNYSYLESVLNESLDEIGYYEEQPNLQDELISQMDSLQFIQFVISLESKLNIGIPDEYLLFEHFSSKSAMLETIIKVYYAINLVP